MEDGLESKLTLTKFMELIDKYYNEDKKIVKFKVNFKERFRLYNLGILRHDLQNSTIYDDMTLMGIPIVFEKNILEGEIKVEIVDL